ncbi:hypothetical protein Patl1_04090 [Pistacia atlantica]|uniref:Uncharacterized protein n=1 Tax=Pistacia atlantica TaxID=434234 RepID=A0ACC1BT47_9ROSI|nr:hypothetical protein Patl1_04090 [Pistacia atlantica]
MHGKFYHQWLWLNISGLELPSVEDFFWSFTGFVFITRYNIYSLCKMANLILQCRFHLTLVITATVCCWMMWAIVYLAQMKPLIVPILSEGE